MVLSVKKQKPLSPHHKKRNGHHHKRTKPYHKAYWPYLPMLAVIGFGFILNLLWPQPGGGVLAYATSMSPSSLLQQTNNERLKAGQSGLVINSQLASAAQAKADDMAARDYWSHVTPDGKQPWWFVNNAGYDYQATGENLAYGFDTELAAVTGWMNSPGHRANILNAGYRDVGFGIANASDYQGHGPETIVVALYGTPFGVDATSTQPAAAPSAAQAPAKEQVAASVSPAPQSQTPASTPATPQAPVSRSQSQPAAVAAGSAATGTDGQRVARLQLVAANISPWSVLMTTLALALLAGIFILRHMYFWHRALVRSERFFIKHWKLDLVLLAVVMLGAILTRTAGFIQ